MTPTDFDMLEAPLQYALGAERGQGECRHLQDVPAMIEYGTDCSVRRHSPRRTCIGPCAAFKVHLFHSIAVTASSTGAGHHVKCQLESYESFMCSIGPTAESKDSSSLSTSNLSGIVGLLISSPAGTSDTQRSVALLPGANLPARRC